MSKKLPILILVYVATIYAAQYGDKIVLNHFNKTFVFDEVYTFRLVPLKEVPKRISVHTIYTASETVLRRSVKRVLVENQKRLLITHEHIPFLEEFFGDDHEYKRSLDSSLFVDAKKRDIAKRDAVSLTEDVLLKRSVIGTEFCLHIPWFTTCSNSGSLEETKEAMHAIVDTTVANILSTQETNTARLKMLNEALDEQRDLIADMGNAVSQNAQDIELLSLQLENVTNSIRRSLDLISSQGNNGDLHLFHQLKSLEYNQYSILNYNEAFQSTDPRSLLVQPSLIELYAGYMSSLEVIRENNSIPIVSGADTHNFVGVSLNVHSLRNVSVGTGVIIENHHYFPFSTGTTTSFFYGAFFLQHQAIFKNFPSEKAYSGDTMVRTSSDQHCVTFLGSKMLAVTTTTPQMVNGISQIHDITECNAYRIRSATGRSIYSLISMYGDYILPFYSNCDRDAVSSFLTETNIMWGSELQDSPTLSPSDNILINSDVYERHYISSTGCYISIDPTWLYSSYYVEDDPSLYSIENIPFGYNLEQFTTNPLGELSSSLSFTYTDKWLNVYTARRISNNDLIVSDIQNLEGKNILFDFIETEFGTMVVDEMNSFYGQSNSGRDCVSKNTEFYFFNPLDCLFNNDDTMIIKSRWEEGTPYTSGISSLGNQFTYSYEDKNGERFITLTPKKGVQFTYYFDDNSLFCPDIVNINANEVACELDLFYTFENRVKVGESVIQFDENGSGRFRGPAGTYLIQVNGEDCKLVNCKGTVKTDGFVQVYTPAVTIISENSANLNTITDLDYPTASKIIQQSIKDVDVQIDEIVKNVKKTQEAIQNIIKQLYDIDFNVTSIEYEDFSDRWDEVRDQIDSIKEGSACRGMFGSLECFFAFLASFMILAAVVVVICIVTYCCLCRNTGNLDVCPCGPTERRPNKIELF